MTARVRHYSLRTVIPTNELEHSRAMRQLANRDGDLTAIGLDGFELVSTVVLPGNDIVTLIDTFKRIDSEDAR